MMFNIIKEKNGEYCYIGENRTEVQERFMAVKLSETDARNYVSVLEKDGFNYVLAEC